MIEFRNCSKCGTRYEKPQTTSKVRWNSRKYCTKECRKLDVTLKTAKERSVLRTRNYRLKRVFGITLQDYNRMFSEQEGKCKICFGQQTILRTSLAVDHDHKTGRVRGLLCNTCNRALGMLHDNPALLQRASLYLQE